MRAVVVLLDERIESRLLLQHVRRRRLGRFALERQMHPLVAAVLLWLPWLNALNLDAEPQPPHRQPAEAVERVPGGERDAVVGTDRTRQAEFLEGPLKRGEGEFLLRPQYGFHKRQQRSSSVRKTSTPT